MRKRVKTNASKFSSPTGQSGRQCEDILAQGQQSEKYTKGSPHQGFSTSHSGGGDQFQQGMEVGAVLLLVKTILSPTCKSLC